MGERTIFLSKLIGVYCVVLAIAMALNKAATLQMVGALLRDAPVLYVLGSIITAAGLAVVIQHNRWSGLPAVLVTIIAWAALVKGLLFLLFPPNAAVGIALWGVPYQRFYYADVVVAFVLGSYLAYYGFTARRVPR
jgi:hypothetical protein